MSDHSFDLPQTQPPAVSNVKRILFWLVVGLQFAVLALIIVDRKNILDSGETVFLKCQPIDPRSLFSGDYVILTYEISRLTGEQMSDLYTGQDPIKRGETVYVFLQRTPGAEFHRPVAVSKRIDGYTGASDGKTTVMQGVAQNYFSPIQDASQSSPLVIRYGVENYFVPQGEGKIIENSLEKGSVEVAVRTTSGESAIRKLFLDGKEVVFH